MVLPYTLQLCPPPTIRPTSVLSRNVLSWMVPPPDPSRLQERTVSPSAHGWLGSDHDEKVPLFWKRLLLIVKLVPATVIADPHKAFDDSTESTSQPVPSRR